MRKAQRVLIAATGLAILFSMGCVTPVRVPMTKATLGYLTATQKDLRALPLPKGPIVVAVYSFRDQTGQYKPIPNVTSFSTAVTQGAASMLIQALKDSRWFIPVEREGLSDLLTERKIVRAKINGNGGNGGKGGNGDDKKKDFPSLLDAPVLLEGGIVAYETNVLTGGVGAKYFGAGGSTESRKDQITVYLRAVDVGRGEIVKAVNACKSILSQQVDVGLFRFVSFKRLLEVEAGFTTNEPPQLCVLEAIEKAVLSLIIEGIVDGNWVLKDPNDINLPVIQDYLKEKKERIMMMSNNPGKEGDEKQYAERRSNDRFEDR